MSIAVAALSTGLLAAPASSDEFTDSLAFIWRAMVGHWSGKVSGTDASGETFESQDAFTFVLTSENGLDSATWSADTLEMAVHEGGGRYRVRNWNRTGRQRETGYQLRIVEGPDASGNGAWVLELQQSASNGTVMEVREYFTLHGNMLNMIIQMRPAGSDEAFKTMVVGVWSREPN